jgi:hypothetical protein
VDPRWAALSELDLDALRSDDSGNGDT